MCNTCLEMEATWVDSCWTILASADTSVDVAGSGESLLLLLSSSVSKGMGILLTSYHYLPLLVEP